jgi:hypothetical protein
MNAATATARITPDQAAPGMFIIYDEKRWQVTAATPVADGGVRLRLSRAWCLIQALQASVTWAPGQWVLLAAAQGRCGGCGQDLTHGLAEETPHFRAGGRYFCPDSAGGLHHPRIITPDQATVASGDVCDMLAEAITTGLQAGLDPEAIRATFEGTMAMHTDLEPPAPPLAPWCLTCGNPVENDKCCCWGMIADALQRYLGTDFDGAASMASQLWEATDPVDRARVWAAEYAEQHDVPVYPDERMFAPAEVRAADKLAHPHDTDCPRCGRRAWDEPDEEAQCRCTGCGWDEATDGGFR